MKYLGFTNNTQVGFTLIELMITLVLGLLISAAALQLFYNTSRNVRIQESADDVQDAVVFSLGYIQKEIAMANLGSYQPMTHDSPWTGIVLSTSEDNPSASPSNPVVLAGKKPQIGNLRGVNLTQLGGDTDKIISKSAHTISNVKSGGSNLHSDQLVIQYKAPFSMTDCEGRTRNKDDIIIERFYTAQDTSISTSNPKLNIALFCEAGSYRANQDAIDPTTKAVIKDKDNKNVEVAISSSEVPPNTFELKNINKTSTGVILVNRVDYFKVLLGLQAKNGIRYMTIDEYNKAIKAEKTSGTKILQNTPIVSVQIGIITRGIQPISTDAQTDFKVLGSDVSIADNSKKYIRRVYEHTIRLRNGVAQ